MRLIRAFLADVRGAAAIEYGLIAALISVDREELAFRQVVAASVGSGT